MVAHGITGAARIADHLALLYLLARSGGDGETVNIQRFRSAAVVHLSRQQ